MSHVGDRIFDLVAGTLPAPERAALDGHAAACSACAAEVADATEAFAALALAATPALPPPGGRDRLLAAATGSLRLGTFLDAVARLFDLGRERAAALLDQVDEPARWESGPVPGIRLLHLQGGPAVAAADNGFVRLPAGMKFPRHRHLGEERVLLLQGGIHDEDGTISGPGDLLIKAAGTAHRFDVLEGDDLIYALVLFGGIDFRAG